MGFAGVWNRTLVYFGIAEEDDDWDEDGYLTEEDLERTYSERPNVRRLKPRRGRGGADYDDIFSDDEPRAVSARRRPPDAPAQNGHRAAQQVSLVVPKSFNDAQTVADKLKADVPVIINFQGADADLAKRLVDFSSGLAYATGGTMARVADRVYLLTPSNVEISQEEKDRLQARGLFQP